MSNFGQIWPNIAKARPNLAKFGRHPANVDQKCCPQIGPNLVNIGRQNWPAWAETGSSLAHIGQTRHLFAEIGPCLAKLVKLGAPSRRPATGSLIGTWASHGRHVGGSVNGAISGR